MMSEVKSYAHLTPKIPPYILHQLKIKNTLSKVEDFTHKFPQWTQEPGSVGMERCGSDLCLDASVV